MIFSIENLDYDSLQELFQAAPYGAWVRACVLLLQSVLHLRCVSLEFN